MDLLASALKVVVDRTLKADGAKAEAEPAMRVAAMRENFMVDRCER
jgi:hypothetical protein